MATLALGAPYRRLWSATLLSNLGDGVRAAAFPLAIGGLSGGFFAAALTRRIGVRITTLACLALAAAGQLALGTTSSVILTAAVLATSSMAFAIWNVQARTTIQRTVPAHLLGRVISINGAVITAASLAGAGLGGITASRLGLHAPFLLGIPVLVVAGTLTAVTGSSAQDSYPVKG
ncbi:MFS transporter [Catenulispora pinisilvae]|uniref:MFS transporter n=1 Tax=Catenulispora pinisilvae TaxID=2705253 RepID=UPI001891A666|nr:MFS transporter [Catenulispora pinisilvae]